MEMWGLRVTDDYDSWSVTLPSGDAADYAATQLALGSKEAMKQAQVTSTTIEGGMSRVDVKIQSLEKSPTNEGTEEDEEPGSEDPEDDPDEDEEEEAGYGPNHAKTTSAEINFQVAPLPTHPYFADIAEVAGSLYRTMVGAVHRGWSVYRPMPYEDGSNQLITPIDYLGDEMCGLLTSIHTYTVKVISITYEYTTFRNMSAKIAASEIGAKIDKNDMPSNTVGGTLPQGANCYFLGRNIRTSWVNNPFVEEGQPIDQRKAWTVSEHYMIEIIPSIEEVKRRGDCGPSPDEH